MLISSRNQTIFNNSFDKSSNFVDFFKESNNFQQPEVIDNLKLDDTDNNNLILKNNRNTTTDVPNTCYPTYINLMHKRLYKQLIWLFKK